MNCPYQTIANLHANRVGLRYTIRQDYDHAVHMIGHHHERVQFHIGIVARQFFPCHLHDDLARQVFPVVRAQGDEIPPGDE